MILAIVLAVFIFWVLFFFFKLRKPNPYIKAHKLKNRNDKDYQEYLAWVHKNKMTTPYSKLETLEEQIENYKIKNLLK